VFGRKYDYVILNKFKADLKTPNKILLWYYLFPMIVNIGVLIGITLWAVLALEAVGLCVCILFVGAYVTV